VPSAYFAGGFTILAPRQPRDNAANGGAPRKSVIPKICVSLQNDWNIKART